MIAVIGLLLLPLQMQAGQEITMIAKPNLAEPNLADKNILLDLDNKSLTVELNSLEQKKEFDKLEAKARQRVIEDHEEEEQDEQTFATPKMPAPTASSSNKQIRYQPIDFSIDWQAKTTESLSLPKAEEKA